MEFTEDELTTLNTFLNGAENLPVDIEAINVKLRSHFSQDVSVETPEVEAAVVADTASETPVDAPVPEEDSAQSAPDSEPETSEAPVEDTDADSMVQAQDPETSAE